MNPIVTTASAKTARWAGLVAVFFLAVPLILAQGPPPPFVSNNPSQILSAFQAARGSWIANVSTYANALFGALAVIEFAWSAAVMVLEKADLQSWTSALIRKIMWIGGFYMLLINGPTWIPFIIDSFTQIGQNSSGVVSISPSAVFAQGLAVAGALSNGFSIAGFLTQPAVIFSLIVAAVIVVISYAMITIQFLVAIVESYIVVAAGFIFLGFGGSRWTAPYAERYIGLAVSNGTKIMVIYLLIAVGSTLGNAWVAEAQSASTSASPIHSICVPSSWEPSPLPQTPLTPASDPHSSTLALSTTSKNISDSQRRRPALVYTDTFPDSPTLTAPPVTAAARYFSPNTSLLDDASQYCASVTSTFNTAICGSSSPSGNQALNIGFHNS